MIDPLISYYLRDSVGVKREYLYHSWQDVVKQYPNIRKRFNSFGEFGASTLPEMFSDGLLDDAVVYTFNTMESSWIENTGKGTFVRHSLPLPVQVAPMYGIAVSDFNADGWTDLLMVGNDFGMEVQQGRADAFNGALLLNTGPMGGMRFKPIPQEESGFYVPGDGKALVRLQSAGGGLVWVASQNNDRLKAFAQEAGRLFHLQPDEVRAIAELKDGSQKLYEAYWGSGFKSQSERVFVYPEQAVRITTFDTNGKPLRTIPVSAN